MDNLTRFAFFLLVTFSCCALIANAQQRGRISHVVVRTDTLRGKTDSLARVWVTSSIDTARIIKNWPNLKKGLSQQAVRDMLGLPASIEQDFENAFTYWWYGQQAVAFNSITHKVAFWDK